MVVEGLATETRYFFVVRAQDAQGNVDGNTMSDEVAPTWGAGSTTTLANCGTSTSGSITLDWPAASDACPGPTGLRYRLCRVQGRAAGECVTSWFSDYSTADSTSSHTLSTGLASNTSYSFYVRAEDGFGNLEASSHGPFTTTTRLSLAARIQPTWSAPAGTPGGCASCHSWNYAATVGVTSGCNGLKYIVPGDPAASHMWQKINGTPACGNNMPAGGFTVSSTWRADLTTWINQGACNN